MLKLLASLILTLMTLPLYAETTVTLQLKWKHQFQFAGYYAAIEKGYYKAKGLNVILREAEEGKDPVEHVLQGAAEFGVGTSELAVLRSEKKPIVVLAAIMQHSPLIILSHADKINTPHDLVGKKIMLEPQSAEILAYLKSEGISIDSLLISNHNFHAKDLIEEKVESISAYSTDEPYYLMKAKIKYMTFSPRSGGIDFYGDCLFTTEKQIDENPKLVKDFLEASIAGWKYAMSHQSETVDLIYKKYSQRHEKDHLLFEAQKMKEIMSDDLVQIGHINPGRWEHIVEIYKKMGMIKGPVDLDSFIYNPEGQRTKILMNSVIALALICALLVFILFPIWIMNKRLKKEIFQRKKAEEENTKMQAKLLHSDKLASIGTLAAGVAHEINNPLTIISSYADIIKLRCDNKCGEDTPTKMNHIVAATKRIATIVNGLRLYARQDNEAIENIDVHLCINETLEFIKGVFEKDDIKIELRLKALNPFIKANKGKIQQILINMLVNARDALSEKEEGLIIIESSNTNSKLELKISDNGTGIPPHHIPRLFDPFFTTKRPGKGTGLGLSICHTMIESFGGSIHVDSEEEKGTSFQIFFPSDKEQTI